MKERQKRLLEGISSRQSTNRRRHRNKREAVDAMLESARGARPSDALAGVDIQTDMPEPGDGPIAPVAGSLEIDGEIDTEVPEPGEELVPPEGEGPAEGGEISQELIDMAIEKAGLKPISIEGMDMEALKKGQEHELEHTEDPAVAAAIAAHHIDERGDYYEMLDELEGEESEEEPENKGDEEPDLDDYEEVPFGADDEEDGEDSEEEEESETDEPKGDEEGDD